MEVSADTIDALFKLDHFRGLELHGPRDTRFIGAGSGAFVRWRLDPRRCILLTRAAVRADGEPYSKVIGSAPKDTRELDLTHIYSYDNYYWDD